MLNNSDRFALEACKVGHFIGANSRREAAVIAVGRELSDRAIHRIPPPPLTCGAELFRIIVGARTHGGGTRLTS